MITKLYEKWTDSETGITVKVSKESLTFKTRGGRLDFVFKGSKRKTVAKVLKSLMQLSKIEV